MDALVSDCDGVIVDNEPVHFACFRDVLAGRDVTLTEEAYRGQYLGLSDYECFELAGRDAGVCLEPAQVERMAADKSRLFQERITEILEPMPGVAAIFEATVAAGIPVGICSGGLRSEVTMAAEAAGIREMLGAMVCAEDVQLGKPDPEGYRLALAQLAASVGRGLQAQRTVVLEDSPLGMAAAKALGMRVVAVTSTYQAAQLQGADRIVGSLEEITVDELRQLVE
jgi:beta-phosphoglucomutase